MLGFASIAYQHLGQRLSNKHVVLAPSSGEAAALQQPSGQPIAIWAKITAFLALVVIDYTLTHNIGIY